ncbi:hypothetical protein FA13DRAFT_1722032 [Coprinellus micaceus]|uniref:Uncharacterized protein n=1 Tax=Coprinellus micaceus TaxID=71717 RepID=A0A4Y7RSG1_COPMI|nr:hypothetical protein FA13DRAFT_1722032 [Coprinellus micaceus]
MPTQVALTDFILSRPNATLGAGGPRNKKESTLQRGIAAGLPTDSIPMGQMRGNQAPTNLPASGKQAVVKIQIPPVLKNPDGSYNDMMVYTAETGLRLHGFYDVIRTKTISQLKGYFSAEIKSRDEFAVKVSEVLASQPW